MAGELAFVKKITIDSATLMNKMLELIEAHKLFEFPLNKLEILIHQVKTRF